MSKVPRQLIIAACVLTLFANSQQFNLNNWWNNFSPTRNNNNHLNEEQVKWRNFWSGSATTTTAPKWDLLWFSNDPSPRRDYFWLPKPAKTISPSSKVQNDNIATETKNTIDTVSSNPLTRRASVNGRASLNGRANYRDPFEKVARANEFAEQMKSQKNPYNSIKPIPQNEFSESSPLRGALGWRSQSIVVPSPKRSYSTLKEQVIGEPKKQGSTDQGQESNTIAKSEISSARTFSDQGNVSSRKSQDEIRPDEQKEISSTQFQSAPSKTFGHIDSQNNDFHKNTESDIEEALRKLHSSKNNVPVTIKSSADFKISNSGGEKNGDYATFDKPINQDSRNGFQANNYNSNSRANIYSSADFTKDQAKNLKSDDYMYFNANLERARGIDVSQLNFDKNEISSKDVNKQLRKTSSADFKKNQAKNLNADDYMYVNANLERARGVDVSQLNFGRNEISSKDVNKQLRKTSSADFKKDQAKNLNADDYMYVNANLARARGMDVSQLNFDQNEISSRDLNKQLRKTYQTKKP